MLYCHTIILSASAAVDRKTGAFSLFNLVDNIVIGPEALGQVLPIEVHLYWQAEKSAFDTEFEMRLVRARNDGKESTGNIASMKIDKSSRLRKRFHALQLPDEYGTYRLLVEWRKKDDEEWIRDSTYWPLTISQDAGPSLNTPQ
jgi:hypothetical protein